MPPTMPPPNRRRHPLVLLVSLLYASSIILTVNASSTTADADALPGSRPWIIERPELHGLSANTLEAASANVETIVARDCFLVAKDGVLVHESYYGGDDSSRVGDSSVGALATTLATGIASLQGLFNLDEPLGRFGLRGVDALFGETYGGEVTVRQLLGRTHGGGTRAPGLAFEVDSEEDGFLDIIGELIEARSGVKLKNWATMHIGEKIGAPDMFRDTEGSLRRNLRASCRDAAKLGQIFVNKGKWISEDGEVRQMIDPSFALTAMSVSYPSLNQAHGLMAWLHVPTSPTGTKCCKPQTTKTSCGESAEEISGPILGTNAPHAPVAIMVGNEGSMIYMLPETRTVVVTLGRTVAGTPACPVAPSDVMSKLGSGRRDDAFLVRTLWDAMSGALKPSELDFAKKSGDASRVGTSSAERDWHRWSEKDVKAHGAHSSSHADVGEDESISHKSILDTVREALANVMDARSEKSEGLVHDGHATYEYEIVKDDADDDESARGDKNQRHSDDSPKNRVQTRAEKAAEEYKAKQLAYARDMQEREYKRYEDKIQRDYQRALKAVQYEYQESMRAAQDETDVVVRAKLENEAAATYMDGVNTVEESGKDSLEHLDSWRAATMPPKQHAFEDAADLGETKKMQTLSLDAIEKNSQKMHTIVASASSGAVRSKVGGVFAKLGAASARSFSRGSCVCSCPNTQAPQAACFDVDATDLTEETASEVCGGMHSRAALGCPHTGIVQQCGQVVGKRGLASESLECRQVRRCPQTETEAKSHAFLAAVFDCRPNQFASCSYVAQPCEQATIVVKPVIADKDAVSVRLERGDGERAAHKFHDHDHVSLSHNALVRWVQQASPEVSVSLAVAILGLALIAIARKWPTAVTGGENPFSQITSGSGVGLSTKRRLASHGSKTETVPLLNVNTKLAKKGVEEARVKSKRARPAEVIPFPPVAEQPASKHEDVVIKVDDDEKDAKEIPEVVILPRRVVIEQTPRQVIDSAPIDASAADENL